MRLIVKFDGGQPGLSENSGYLLETRERLRLEIEGIIREPFNAFEKWRVGRLILI